MGRNNNDTHRAGLAGIATPLPTWICAAALSMGMLAGCDEGNDRGVEGFAAEPPADACDVDDGECKADDAYSIRYSCETAGKDGNGTWWSYQATSFNNASSEVGLAIYKGAEPDNQVNMESIGVVALPKTATDTWSDGNLTLSLGYKSANAGANYGAKSIRVSHGNAGVTAQFDSGYCQDEQLPTLGEGPPGHEDGTSLADELSGVWRASDPATTSDLEFRLEPGHDGKAIGVMVGRMRCNVSTGGPGEPVSGASFPSSVAYNLFSIILAALQQFENYACATDSDGEVTGSLPVWITDDRGRLKGNPPGDFCLDGNRFGDVWTINGYEHAGWICISNHGPTSLSMYGYKWGKGASDWVGFNK